MTSANWWQVGFVSGMLFQGILMSLAFWIASRRR